MCACTADKREEIDEASAGDIVAIMGIDSASGDTYAFERDQCTLESMFVPEPVIKIAVNPTSRSVSCGQDGQSPAAVPQRRSHVPCLQSDEETKEMLISGMGELHLDIYVERIRREYNVAIWKSERRR